MTVHWFDFTASTSGNGTYASPFNGSVQSISNLAPAGITHGDEIRLRSFTLTEMTDFTFTASYTVTSGAPNLYLSDVSQFSVGDVIMYDDDKTCFVIHEIGADYIKPYYSFATNAAFHFSVTDRPWRRIKTEYGYLGSDHRYIHTGQGGTSKPNNLTISDGWINETTRVTDKSAMTILHHQTKTSGSCHFYLEDLGDNLTVDMQQSIMMSPGGSGSATFRFQDIGTGCTAHLHQLWGGMYSAQVYMQNTVGAGADITLNYHSGYYGPSGSGPFYASDFTFTVKNAWLYSTYYDNRNGGSNVKMIVEDVYSSSSSGGFWDYSGKVDATFEFNGALRGGSGGQLSHLTHGGASVKLGPNFKVYSDGFSSNGPTEQTSMSYVFQATTGQYSSTFDYIDGIELTNLSSMTFVKTGYFSLRHYTTSTHENRHLTARVNIHDSFVVYDSSKTTNAGDYSTGTSTLIQDVNPNNLRTYEHLQDQTKYYQPIHGVAIHKDFSVFKYNAPSLKFIQQTWQNVHTGKSTFVKALNLPVDGDGATQFTVSFWYTCEPGDEMFNAALGGSFVARVVYDDNSFADVSIESIATSWTEYTIPFVPADKQLAQLQFRMDTVESGFFYITDIGVS